ncbi:hypothetical protein KSP39_PZI023900 [Platanthera zijinensis]|uniref:Uncharacterized protein n=1 Tax=Platanthera zijinensis TaxID=2320716 RepID=A0AAP0ATZ1_9ASPA
MRFLKSVVYSYTPATVFSCVQPPPKPYRTKEHRLRVASSSWIHAHLFFPEPGAFLFLTQSSVIRGIHPLPFPWMASHDKRDKNPSAHNGRGKADNQPFPKYASQFA